MGTNHVVEIKVGFCIDSIKIIEKGDSHQFLQSLLCVPVGYFRLFCSLTQPQSVDRKILFSGIGDSKML